MSEIVKVKPIRKNDWNGHVRYRNTKDSVSPLFSQTGTIITGLDLEQEERLGKVMQKNLSPASPFWYEYRVIFTDKEREFNLSNPEHELAVSFLKAHKRVANSGEDLDKGLYPEADYLMYNEAEEAKVRNREFTIKRKAVASFNDLTEDQMTDILKLYPGYVNLKSVTRDVIESTLYQKLEEDPSKFLSFVGDKKLDMKVFLKDLVNAKILRKNKSAYYYGEDFLGHDEESTITFLDDPKHQSLKISFKQKLEENK